MSLQIQKNESESEKDTQKNEEIIQQNKENLQKYHEQMGRKMADEIYSYIKDLDDIWLQKLGNEIEEQMSLRKLLMDAESPVFVQLIKEGYQNIISLQDIVQESRSLDELQRIQIRVSVDRLKQSLAEAKNNRQWIFKENQKIIQFFQGVFELVQKLKEELQSPIKNGLCSSNSKKFRNQLQQKADQIENHSQFVSFLLNLESWVQIDKSIQQHNISIDSLDIQEQDILDIIQLNLEQEVPKMLPIKEIVTQKEVQKEIQIVERIQTQENIVIQEVKNELIQAIEKYHGIGCHQDVNAALKLFQKLSEEQDPDADYYLAKMHLKGKAVPIDYQKAEKYFQKGVSYNSIKCISGLIKLIDKRNPSKLNTQQKNQEIFKLTKQASDLGHTECITDLGYFYEQGQIIEQDLYLAKQLYQKAADKGSARAMNNLASLLLKLDVYTQDQQQQKQAFDLYSKSAEQNYAPGLTNLGICYMKGIGVLQSASKSLDFFQRSQELGDFEAMFYVAYFKLKEGYQLANESNYNEALSLLQKIIQAKPRHQEALYYIGHIYENGLGVQKDFNTAFQYYQRAFQSTKNPTGKIMYKIGHCYENNIGTQGEDFAKALDFYQNSAQKGDLDAQVKIGSFYQYGIVLEKDIGKAIQIYKECQKQGSTMAKQHLIELAQQGVIFDEQQKENTQKQWNWVHMNKNLNFETLAPFQQKSNRDLQVTNFQQTNRTEKQYQTGEPSLLTQFYFK